MARHNPNQGIGGIVIALGMIFFVLFLMLIPTLPFQISEAEQALMYLMSFIVVIAGLVLALK